MIKKIFSTLLCFCCLYAAAQEANPIQEAMGNYDYETALTLIEQQTPTTALLYQKGKALKGLGNNAEALEVFREVAVQDSLNPRAYIELAECCRSLAKYNEALDYYRDALQLNPDNKFVRIQLISLLMSLKRYRESLAESNLLAESDSSAYVLHLQADNLDKVYGYTAQLDRVVEAYKEIRRRYPDDYLAVAKLGKIYTQCYEYDEAIGVTEAYREKDSTNLLVNRVNAQAYCLSKDYPKAIERYRWLLQEKDSTFQTCYYGGICHYAAEDFYTAHDLLEKAHKEDPTNINVLYYLGRACAKTSWKEEGVNYLEAAVKIALPSDSTMSRLYVGLADCYKMNRRYRDQAEAILTNYEHYDRENHRLLYDAAYVYYFRAKDMVSAERCLEAFIETRPKDLTQAEATSNYDAAVSMLYTIRNKRKQDDFFQGKVDTASVIPIR